MMSDETEHYIRRKSLPDTPAEGAGERYRGWLLYDNGQGHNPATERWVAKRWGVQKANGFEDRISATTRDMMISMIDFRRGYRRNPTAQARKR